MVEVRTPSIRVSQHHRYLSPGSERHSPPSSGLHSPASPMSIPNAVRDPPVPPPLPPPRDVPVDDINYGQNFNQQKEWNIFSKDYVTQHWSDFGKDAAVKPGSSLLGGKRNSAGMEQEDSSPSELDFSRRGSSISTVTPTHKGSVVSIDEKRAPNEYDEILRPLNYRLQSERQLEQRTLDHSSNAYDQKLLSKIGGPNTPSRLSVSYAGGLDVASASPAAEGRPEHSRQMSASSDNRQVSLDNTSISKWPQFWPTSGNLSPGSFRNPVYEPENSRPLTHRRPSFPPADDSASHRSSHGSYDQAMFMQDEFPMEEGPMKDLNINDRSPSISSEFHVPAKAGMKRRASSPHRESARDERASVSSAPGGNDLYSRRSLQQIPSRNCSVSRQAPKFGSVSSVSSYGPRSGSMASSYGLSVASSATSYTPSGRLSPGALSPAIDPELGSMPYPTAAQTASRALNPSPGPQAIACNPRPYLDSPQNASSQASPVDSAPQSRHNSIPNAQGLFVCACCPKKPKKFSTEEELRGHTMEKQYSCAFCPNRFKNKNEAERHQNSLHLRRHSWSCAALVRYEDAFHPCPNNGGATDICGFCGLAFPNPPVWQARREHVFHFHKFGECNQAKKFFRADHFRQHLKHSHAGNSGKWTNTLEGACMRDESPPQPMMDRGASTANIGCMPPMVNTIPPPAPVGSIMANGQGGTAKPAVIDEVPHET